MGNVGGQLGRQTWQALQGNRHCLDKAASTQAHFVSTLGVPGQVGATQAQAGSHGKILDGTWQEGYVSRGT